MKNKSIFGTLIAVLFLVSCGKKQEQAAAPAAIPFPVKTINIQDAVVYQEYTANLQGQQNVEIRAKVNGFIQKVYVDEGQYVRKGQLLFKLETQTLNQDASAAKATILKNITLTDHTNTPAFVQRTSLGEVIIDSNIKDDDYKYIPLPKFKDMTPKPIQKK